MVDPLRRSAKMGLGVGFGQLNNSLTQLFWIFNIFREKYKNTTPRKIDPLWEKKLASPAQKRGGPSKFSLLLNSEKSKYAHLNIRKVAQWFSANLKKGRTLPDPPIHPRPPVTAIPGSSPDKDGRFFLVSGRCHRDHRPLLHFTGFLLQEIIF